LHGDAEIPVGRVAGGDGKRRHEASGIEVRRRRRQETRCRDRGEDRDHKASVNRPGILREVMLFDVL
jgi:hypothetical protein